MKALIVEDEQLIADELEHTIGLVCEDIEIIGVLSNLKAARKWFMEHAEPDLIFMDIKLRDGLAFELFENFTLHCPIIFTTAYEEYAIRAFKVNGVDYLLKPVQIEDVKKAIDKCRVLSQNKTLILHDVFWIHRLPGRRCFYCRRSWCYAISIFRSLQSKNEMGKNMLIFANKTKADVILEKIFIICQAIILVMFFQKKGLKVICTDTLRLMCLEKTFQATEKIIIKRT